MNTSNQKLNTSDSFNLYLKDKEKRSTKKIALGLKSAVERIPTKK